MASLCEAARAARKPSRARSGGVLLGAFLACGVVAGSAWAVVSTFGAMQEAADALAEGCRSLVAAADPKPVSTGSATHRLVKIAKFSRLSPPSDSEIRQKQLTADAVAAAHQRRISVQLAAAVKREKAKALMLEAAIARAERAADQERALSGETSMMTALVENVSLRDDRASKPFALVMNKPEVDEEALLGAIPLPEARPALETVVVEEKPVEEKPAPRITRGKDKAKKTEELAYAKPERSLFGDIFKGGNGGTGWPGKGTKVAIYDVSGATVYMPDGTKLRAHSGIGKMRDNPKYDHVKMNGPTPAGIYRLKMRERRFHGVEAIRMTSIDGRDPKNRTGLLTHTNLLRGQIGSHGCVAFQNYEPFLNAFKRGHVDTLIVVPSMPASRTQIAALYRKGA